MERISMLNAICSCSKYRKLSNTKRAELQHERLNRMVHFAKVNSPYYAAFWNDWVTDRNVSLSDIQHFMEDLDHIGRKWNGKMIPASRKIILVLHQIYKRLILGIVN